MSPSLKPLFLPQKVEAERRHQEAAELDHNSTWASHGDNASLSDVASPITPTFSHRGYQARYSSSSSSLELVPPAPPTLERPVSPTKRFLADVQEDPSEQETVETLAETGEASYAWTPNDPATLPAYLGCFCEDSLDSRGAHCPIYHAIDYDDIDYDLGFLSDNDSISPRSIKKRRNHAATISGLASRVGDRIPGFSRWRNEDRRPKLTFATHSEPTLDYRTSLSRAPSSRSSSLSAPVRQGVERVAEPLPPFTPSHSLHESTESIPLADAEQPHDPATFGQTLERQRAQATTPLLPPVLSDAPSASRIQSRQPSPLQSPTIAPASYHLDPVPAVLSPSTTPSLETGLSALALSPAKSATPLSPLSPLSIAETHPSLPAFNLLEQHDAWSDRLGHANYTITPKPYHPEAASLDVMKQFSKDRTLARVNFTKHLARTGEHYGTTSSTYALTEAKWAETEGEWSAAYEALYARVAKACVDDAERAQLRVYKQQGGMPTAAIPCILGDTKGKFPGLGDADIVGPMARDTIMVRENVDAEDKNSTSRFFRNLAEKMGIRK